MNVTDLVWVGLGGSAGAAARFALDGAVSSRVGARLPVGTITVNLTGSFLLGILTGLVMFHARSTLWTTVAGTGFCGGYTTFSTASFETVRLLQQRSYATAALNAVGTLAGALVAGAAGLALARL